MSVQNATVRRWRVLTLQEPATAWLDSQFPLVSRSASYMRVEHACFNLAVTLDLHK